MVQRQEPVSARPHRPVRTCVGCRRRALSTELLRVAVKDGALSPDPRRRIAGRGAWLHPDLECLATAERRRAFPRALRVPGPLDVTAVRTWLQACSEHSTGAGKSLAGKDRKQVDPS